METPAPKSERLLSLDALRGFEPFVREAEVDPARALTTDFVGRASAAGE